MFNFTSKIIKALNVRSAKKEEREVQGKPSVALNMTEECDEYDEKMADWEWDFSETVEEEEMSDAECEAILLRWSGMLRLLASVEEPSEQQREQQRVDEYISSRSISSRSKISSRSTDKTKQTRNTCFVVEAGAPPVPQIPAKYLAKVPTTAEKTDIAFPSIRAELTTPVAVPVIAVIPATPVKKGLAFTALVAISEDDEEEDEEEMEFLVEEEEEEITYKEVKVSSPVIEFAPLREAELVVMNVPRPVARPTTRPGGLQVQSLIRQWEAQQGEEKEKRNASGVWWL